jgi:4'-phosphopantetheinyl transferase
MAMPPKKIFYNPPDHLTPPGEEIHLWLASLQQPGEIFSRLVGVLSPTEQARANRFHFERDRRRFITGRGILRLLLGRYLDIEPGLVQFRYGPQRKPFLSQEQAAGGLHFNLAHSNELVLYAFTGRGEIGVDLEYMRLLPDFGQVANHSFSKAEQVALQALPENQKVEGFYTCWTCKEAYLKALGDGLARPLDKFDVSITPGEPARLLQVEADPLEVTRWWMEAFSPAGSYTAALAAEAPARTVTGWEWSPDW